MMKLFLLLHLDTELRVWHLVLHKSASKVTTHFGLGLNLVHIYGYKSFSVFPVGSRGECEVHWGDPVEDIARCIPRSADLGLPLRDGAPVCLQSGGGVGGSMGCLPAGSSGRDLLQDGLAFFSGLRGRIDRIERLIG